MTVCDLPRTTLKSNNFDFLHFALAALVVFSHSFPLLQGNDSNEPLVQATGQLSLGMLAVNWFFVLSGFLITHSWLHKRDVRDYFRKRILRIFPAFVVAALFCVFVVGPLGSGDAVTYLKKLNPAEFLTMTALLRGYTAPGIFTSLPFPNAVNGSLWTVQGEFWCYLLVALLGFVGAFRRGVFPVVALTGATLLYSVQLWQGWEMGLGKAEQFIAGPQEWPRLLSYYLAGVVFYLYRDRIPLNVWGAIAASVIVLISAVFGAVVNLTLLVFGTYVLFYIAFHSRINLRGFGRYGDFSYGLYLYSFPIQQLLVQQCHTLKAPFSLFLLALPLTIGIAVCSWYFVEKPFLRRKRRSSPRCEPVVSSATTGTGVLGLEDNLLLATPMIG